MEQFIYHNLFETKGIEYIITIIFFALLVPFWMILNRDSTAREQFQAVSGFLTAEILKIPQGLFYCPNHAWSYLEKTGLARIGIDDFLQHMTGEVQLNGLRDLNSRVKKGEQLFEIKQDGRSLSIASPVSGVILEVNPELHENAQNINSDPYGKGWIYRIKPENWKDDMYSCFFAEDASQWMKREMGRFKDFVSASMDKHQVQSAETVSRDNGELMDHPLRSLPAEIWNDFQKEFLDNV